MHATQLLVALAALVAVTGAQEMADKRYVRLQGMPAIKTPPGTVALKRDSSGEMARRIVLEPGMHPMSMPAGAVSHKRDSHLSLGGDGEGAGLHLQSKPLSLNIATGKYHQRSMPLELDSQTMASMPESQQQKYSRSMPLELDSQTLASMPQSEREKYSRRYIIDGQAPIPVGPGRVTAMRREEDAMDRRYVMLGPDGQTYHPKPVGEGKIMPMKRADEMMVNLKTHPHPILPREDYQVGVHPLT